MSARVICRNTNPLGALIIHSVEIITFPRYVVEQQDDLL